MIQCLSIGYNNPEASKHRKRNLQNLSEVTISELSNLLFAQLQCTYGERSDWQTFKSQVEKLAISLSDYSSYLRERNKKVKLLQSYTHPVHSVAENIDFQFLLHCAIGTTPSLLNDLKSCLESKAEFQHVVIEDLCPFDPRKKYEYIQLLKSKGRAMLTYKHGNNVGNTNFVWKVPEPSPDSFCQSQQTIEEVKQAIPTFHTRAMRRSLMQRYGRVTSNVKPAILCNIYIELTGDMSAATNEHKAQIDERVRLLLDMEDPDIVLDLRALTMGQKNQYDVFWDESRTFVEEVIGTPVDDRRHDQVTHLAHAISASDLLEKVRARCPEGTKVPSESWLCLQFWPKSKHAHSKIHYTGNLKVKFLWFRQGNFGRLTLMRTMLLQFLDTNVS